MEFLGIVGILIAASVGWALRERRMKAVMEDDTPQRRSLVEGAEPLREALSWLSSELERGPVNAGSHTAASFELGGGTAGQALLTHNDAHYPDEMRVNEVNDRIRQVGLAWDQLPNETREALTARGVLESDVMRLRNLDAPDLAIDTREMQREVNRLLELFSAT